MCRLVALKLAVRFGAVPITACCGLLVLSAPAAAVTDRDDIVVTATRSEQSSLELPMAISAISGAAIGDKQLQVNLSEILPQIPGVVAHNRQNYAQDLQISIRGFGARSTFGVRGVRLYVDGIPATMPDGQGQLSHIDLSSAERIEILRGPFSALYGNASGGVISVFTASGKPGTTAETDFVGGSFATQREAVKVSGAQGGFDYIAALSNLNSDGYRDHSVVRRSNANIKLDFALDAQSQLKIIANAVDMPEAQDPLGLKREQFEADPKQAGTGAEIFDTRKSVRQQQLGVDYRRTFDDDTFDAMIYGGQRSTTQYQSTPTAAQISPASAGAVIDLDRDYWGTDAHWAHVDALLGKPLQIIGGFSFDNLSEARQGFQNFVGSELGVKGTLRRDESNRVYDFDQYLQAQWTVSDSWLFEAGLRNSKVQVNSRDHYIVPGNGDDSGSVTYSATNPSLGLTWSANDDVRLYMAYGKGFETPTLNELAYKSTSGADTGLNLGLNPSRSEHYETGVKVQLNANSRIDFALFHVITHDELAVASNASGRSVYQNVGKTQRDGAEWQYTGRWDNGFGLNLAYTLLRAKYADDFISCPSAPCTTIAAGKRIPGVPVNAMFGELSWRHAPSGFSTALAVHSESKLYVNDLNSDASDGYTTLDWRAGFSQQLQRWQFEEFVRVDNLTDRNYIGSVIVNESNARYFEPAPGRNSYLGVNIKAQF